jgi:hypothetical protein
MSNCRGTTKTGGACGMTPLRASPDGAWCIEHWPDPPAHIVERRAASKRAGAAKSRETQAEARLLAKVASQRAESDVVLETSDGRVAELKRLVVAVESSGGAAVAKAGAIARLVAEARAEMRGVELEQAYEELRQLVIDKWPAAAASLPPKLRSVR